MKYMIIVSTRLNENHHDVVANVLDCHSIVSEFEFQSRYYIHFLINILEKGMDFLIPLTMDYILSLLFFYKDSFGIKLPMTVDMPLNKEIKSNQMIK